MIEDKIDFAKFVINHNVELINFADTKASVILATSGVLLGLLLFFNLEKLNQIVILEIIITVALLGATIITSFSVVLPRLTSKKKLETVIFYKSIIQQKLDEYKENFKKLDSDSILDDYLGNIHALAKVQDRKYNHLALSVSLMLGSILSLIVTLISYFLLSA